MIGEAMAERAATIGRGRRQDVSAGRPTIIDDARDAGLTAERAEELVVVRCGGRGAAWNRL